MKFAQKIAFLLVASGVVLFNACKDDPTPPNEEELITTLTYTLTPAGGGTPVVLSFKDLDGDGGNAPVITGGTLTAGVTYNGELNLLNESESPSESITEEIEEEDEAHQFFFAATGITLTVTYDDADADGNPVGLKSKVVAGGAGSGTLKITLRHEPNKAGSGVKEGNIANAGGETDIEVDFPVTIQ